MDVIITAPNSLSMLWQIPQYILITAAQLIFVALDFTVLAEVQIFLLSASSYLQIKSQLEAPKLNTFW